MDGTGAHKISDLSSTSLTWSADGSFIVAAAGSNQLKVMKADGSQQTTLDTASPFGNFDPRFTADGEILLFTTGRSTPQGTEIAAQFVVAEFDDSGVPSLRDTTVIYDTTVPRIRYKFICWIPGTSREFFYTRHMMGSTILDGPKETVRAKLVDTGSSGPGRFQIQDLFVATGDEFIQSFYETTPVFSPDGSQVVYFRQGLGLFIADWELQNNASLNRTNERKLYAPALGNHTIEAWVP